MSNDDREYLDTRINYLNTLRDMRWREEMARLERRIDRAEAVFTSRTLTLTAMVGIILLLTALNGVL